MEKIFKITFVFLIVLGFSCSAYADEVFYGRWVVKKRIISAPVSAYDEAGAKAVIGKKIAYSEGVASYDEVINKTAFYRKFSLSLEDFKEEYNVDPVSLGIRTGPVVEVDVYDSQDFSSLWDGLGNILFVKSKNSLVLFSGGVFFELCRESDN